MSSSVTCSFENCGKKVQARGLCMAHYAQWKKGEPLKPCRSFNPGQGCGVAGCDRPAKSKSLCNAHYIQSRNGKEPRAIRPLYAGKTCAFEGCERTAEYRDLCDGHAQQKRRGADLAPLLAGHAARGSNQAESLDGVVYIDLVNRLGISVARAVVDAEDYSRVQPYRWRLSSTGYAVATVSRGKLNMQMSRFLLEDQVTPCLEVDHFDGDRLNNRRSNLRIVTHQQNMQNVRMPKKSGLPRNVYFDRAKRKGAYRVELRCNDHFYRGGHFDTVEEAEVAAKALRAAVFTHHNEDRH